MNRNNFFSNYVRCFRVLQVSQVAHDAVVELGELLLLLSISVIWVGTSPFVALYGVMRPTRFWQFMRWLTD
jgi:hypothetical protein